MKTKLVNVNTAIATESNLSPKQLQQSSSKNGMSAICKLTLLNIVCLLLIMSCILLEAQYVNYNRQPPPLYALPAVLPIPNGGLPYVNAPITQQSTAQLPLVTLIGDACYLTFENQKSLCQTPFERRALITLSVRFQFRRLKFVKMMME